MQLRSVLIVLISLFVIPALGQKLKKADKAIYENLQKHISFLSDDKLEGRRAGTPGEKLASDYISSEMQSLGLQPKGEQGWLQPFDINDGKQVNASTFFIINGSDLKLDKDYFPLHFSANKSTEAAVSIALAERGVPWFFDLKELLEENKTNPHFDIYENLKAKAKAVAEKGATALILYNSSSLTDNLRFNSKERSEGVSIPVLFVTDQARKKFLADAQATLDMKLKVDIGDKKRVGHNVIGYLDNGAAKTVIVGAHYDHLGYGEDGNSMLRTGERLIHNGADDNASGTAALLEIARMVKMSKDKSQNFLFIAFSAEELGLNGSKYFSEHPTIDLKAVKFMLNMDMVGRLNDSTKVLTVGGYGTSPWWGQLFGGLNLKKSLVLKYDSSGTGPSDHTSFYRKDIPVLFFFTGLHGDYHRPTDDFDHINYMGELTIVKLATTVIEKTASQPTLAFTKTRETQTTTSARFSVSMGVMPDYTFAGSGVKVDGVSEGRPAQRAGIKAGDVLIQLGDHVLTSVESYMQALGKFKKGDKAKVKYKRGNETLETEVIF